MPAHEQAPDHAVDGNSDYCQSRAQPSSVTGRICLADVVPERVRWIWPGRIPAGKLVTVDGDPDLGKSALALDITATVTRGGHWPDGTRCDESGDVLIICTDDGAADMIRPRLDAADADVSRVHMIDLGLDESGESMSMVLAAIDAVHTTLGIVSIDGKPYRPQPQPQRDVPRPEPASVADRYHPPVIDVIEAPTIFGITDGNPDPSMPGPTGVVNHDPSVTEVDEGVAEDAARLIFDEGAALFEQLSKTTFSSGWIQFNMAMTTTIMRLMAAALTVVDPERARQLLEDVKTPAPRTNSRNYPPCVHCGEGVATGQRDAQGRPAHLGCRAEESPEPGLKMRTIQRAVPESHTEVPVVTEEKAAEGPVLDLVTADEGDGTTPSGENPGTAAPPRRFDSHPPCFFCDKPVVSRQQDAQGRFVHLGRQAEAKAKSAVPTSARLADAIARRTEGLPAVEC